VSRVGEAEERSDLALYTLNYIYPIVNGQAKPGRLPPGEGGGLGAEPPISKEEDFKKKILQQVDTVHRLVLFAYCWSVGV